MCQVNHRQQGLLTAFRGLTADRVRQLSGSDFETAGRGHEARP